MAILPPEIPNSDSAGWVVGQSCLVIRVDSNEKIDPRVLYTYLKSQIGQIQLKQIISGAAVSIIQLRELDKLEIPVPTIEAQQQIIAGFQKLVELESAISHVRNEQEVISNSLWKL